MLRFNVMLHKRVSCPTRGNREPLLANPGQGVLSVMVNEVRVRAARENSSDAAGF